MRIAAVAVSVAGFVSVSACSSSGPAGTPKAPAPSIGQVVAPEKTAGPAGTAPFGQPIRIGALTITAFGPVTTEKDSSELLVTFHATMTNSSANGDVIGPDWFGVRCDKNRDDRSAGDQMANTTFPQDKHVSAGQTVKGDVVDAWLKWNSIDTCTGPTTIEARFLAGGFVSWTLPADVVARVNAAGRPSS